MRMAVEPGVVDTNVLVYAVNSGAPQHALSRMLLGAAVDTSTSLYVTSQIICEFYSLITNAKRTPMAYSLVEARQLISELLALPGLKILSTPSQAIDVLLKLLERRPVVGSDVFDLQIIATMLANGIKLIYTFNAEDFSAFPELTVVIPEGDA